MSNRQAVIPTIDMSPLFGNDIDFKMEVARQIDAACRDTGFFLVKGHSIDCLDSFFKIVDHFHQTITDEERWDMAIAAYNKNNVDHVLTGYYLPIKDKKVVQSFVSLFYNCLHNNLGSSLCFLLSVYSKSIIQCRPSTNQKEDPSPWDKCLARWGEISWL